jgi:REP-associated tyrosine transposase
VAQAFGITASPGVPRSLRFLQGAGVYGITELRARAQYDSPMPRGLKRFYGSGDLHFITCSCYQRRAWLGTPRRRDLFLRLLEETRTKYRFILLGYVIMPEHFHLLISEPQVGDPSTVLQVLKQRYAQQVLRERRRASKQPGLFEGYAQHVWQARFYDFNVWTERKRIEKLRYMHRNPVKRGLVLEPEQWAWSSFRWYRGGEKGPVQLNHTSIMKLRVKTSAA